MRRSSETSPAMSRASLRAAVLASVCLSAVGLARAETGAAAGADLAFVSREHVQLRPDRTFLRTLRLEATVLTEAGVEAAAKRTFGYDAKLGRFEVVEAFTRKANGDRIDVDPAAILTQHGDLSSSVLTPDTASPVMVFPDVAKGDTVVYTVRLDQHRAKVAGHFDLMRLYGRGQPWDVELTVDAPDAVPLSTEERGLAHRVERVDGGVRHTWRYRSTEAGRLEPGTVNAWETEPRVAVSTAPDYAALAGLFQERYAEKIQVTPKVRTLADEVAGALDDRRQQARALFDWVREHVRYTALSTSETGNVSYDAETVLTRRFGDCKDHVTLYRALLAARGIDSEAVLINTDPSFALPDAAVMGAFNHVIAYVPEFGLYADPTSHLSSFGSLPSSDYGKPVVRLPVAGAPTLARTPVLQAAENRAVTRLTLRLGADGKLAGDMSQGATGPLLNLLRAELKGTGTKAPTVANRLAGQNLRGDGQLVVRKDSDGQEVVTATFAVPNYVAMPPRDGVPIWAAPFLLGRPSFVMGYGAIVAERHDPFPCHATTQVEDIRFEFPDTLSVDGELRNLTIDTPLLSYRSVYKIEPGAVVVHREYTARPGSWVCSAADYATVVPAIRAVRNDLFNRVRLKPKDRTS